MFVLFCFSGINKAIGAIWFQVLVMLIVASFYGYMGTLEMNCAFDHSSPEIYNVTVLDHHIRHGRTTSHYLLLSPWGPMQEAQEMDVRTSLYNATSVGDTLSVNFKAGLFHIPWFVVTKK
jgi:hypothetical protein